MRDIGAAFILLISFLVNASFGQTLTDVARSKELTWYGIDFTQSRFIGFKTTELNNTNLQDWGYTLLTESEVNMIRSSFGKKFLEIETSTAQTRNSALDCKELTVDFTYGIDIEKIKKAISEYKINGTGYGVIFIVESVEKVSNSIFIWVVYINNSTGQIISARRYTGCGLARDNRRGAYYGNKGIKLVFKLSGKDLKKYKK